MAKKRSAGRKTPARGAENDLPSTVQRSDEHAQRLFTEARASARKTYDSPARVYRVAYAALKHEYQRQGDRWARKAQQGPSDPQAARGPTTDRKSTDKPAAPTAGGKVARGADAQRRKKASPVKKAARKKAAKKTTRKKAAKKKTAKKKATPRKKTARRKKAARRT